MSAGYWCMWAKGKAICAKPATHGTMLGEGTYYLCKTHAATGKMAGWRGVKPLKPVGTA